MEIVAKNSYFVPSSNQVSFDLKRAAIEYQLSTEWCKSKQERSIKSKQGKETKLIFSQSGICRKSKNTNRSPRQVRRNERERGRKARLNAAFKVLRNVIPFYSEGLSKEKLTQVQVLRLAAKYITTLSDILGSESCESEDEYYVENGQFQEYQQSYQSIMQYVHQQ
eukprot:Seg213.6 transcript_id=Seg213.6/GoldUCD/mRNA.D3Y31 product="Neurogenic differentiation factor 1" protein_id=Seg213.6/GoldUCD/D3Y31